MRSVYTILDPLLPCPAPLQVTDRTSLKMVPEQLKLLVRKLLVIISRVARLLEILVGVAFSFKKLYKLYI